MGALLGLLAALLRLVDGGHITEDQVLIFSDSECCVGFLERGWNRPTDLVTARKTRAALHKLRGHKKVTLYWIRGHSQVHWNEVADRLARRGADIAELQLLPPPGSGAPRRASRRAAV